VALASPPPPPPASVVVELDPPDIIQKALLMDPECTIVDVRGIDEIKATGIFNPQSAIRNGLRWISAPCTLQECSPLLEDPAICDVMIRSKTAPLVVHCASGKRANIAKQVLLSHGYTNVYNAGAYPNDTKQYE
jgi:rhodanese-related sulfurtransferase